MRLNEYVSALFHGWVGKMSGLASIILTFLPIFFPKAFSSSEITAKAVWIAAAICFLIASYAAWNAERIAKEKALADLVLAKADEAVKRAEAKVARDWPAEWKDLARQFEAVNAHSVRADWQHTSGGEGWMICGGDPHANNNLETLCSFAGKMLAISPRVSSILSSDISSCPHPMSRWLYLLKQRNKGYETGFVGWEVFEAKDGIPERKVACYTGSIRELAVVSASQCIECATHEL